MKFRDVLLLVVGTVAFIAALVVLSWVAQGNAFALYRYFAPKTEAVRRETFEQSKAYRQGLVQELQNMQFQYEQATPDHRAALRSIILRRVADVPDDALTVDLRAFISTLRRAQ